MSERDTPLTDAFERFNALDRCRETYTHRFLGDPMDFARKLERERAGLVRLVNLWEDEIIAWEQAAKTAEKEPGVAMQNRVRAHTIRCCLHELKQALAAADGRDGL